jgi:hypothetical protein
MTQAVAADYADAMLVARRAKNVLFFFLALVLLIQLGVFFVVRYVPAVNVRPQSSMTVNESATITPATEPSTNLPAPMATGLAKWNWPRTLHFWITSADFLGVVLSMMLPAILLLIVTIMLVGRLVGVSHVTSAFCWSIVFLVILFPWQVLLAGRGSESDMKPLAPGSLDSMFDKPEITFPGVLYTYPELRNDYNFPSSDWKNDWPSIVLKWMRFAGWPVVELIILLMIQFRSGRGLKFALGEADVPLQAGATG